MIGQRPTVRSALRSYWTERLPVRRWVFVVLWVDVGLSALNGTLRMIERFLNG